MGVQGAKPPAGVWGRPQFFLFPKMLVDYALGMKESPGMEEQRKTKPLRDIEAAFEHMPVGVALFDARDLRLLIANASFRKFLDTYLAPSWKYGRAINHPLQD